MIRRLTPSTLRGRLALLALATTALWVALLTVVFNLALGSELRRQADDLLRTRASAASATVDIAADGSITVRDPGNDGALDTGIWIFRGVVAGKFAHGQERALAELAASFSSQCARDLEVRGRVQPAGEAGMADQCGRFLRQQHENGLGDILGQVPVGSELPQRRVIDQGEVTLHEFGKRRLGIRFSELLQQRDVIAELLGQMFLAHRMAAVFHHDGRTRVAA